MVGLVGMIGLIGLLGWYRGIVTLHWWWLTMWVAWKCCKWRVGIMWAVWSCLAGHCALPCTALVMVCSVETTRSQDGAVGNLSVVWGRRVHSFFVGSHFGDLDLSKKNFSVENTFCQIQWVRHTTDTPHIFLLYFSFLFLFSTNRCTDPCVFFATSCGHRSWQVGNWEQKRTSINLWACVAQCSNY